MNTKTRFYIAAVALATIGLFVWQMAIGPSIPWLKLAFFSLLFILTETKPVLLPKVSMTVTFMLIVVAFTQLPVAGLVLAGALSVGGTLLGGQRPALPKLIFNSAQLGLSSGLAAYAYRVLGGGSVIAADHLPILLTATLGATAIYFLVNTSAVSGAIAVSTGAPFAPTWSSQFGWLTVTYAAFGGTGLILAGLYQAIGVVALPLLLVPLLVARGMFRSYQEVSEAYQSTVLAFVAAIEAKDAYTRGHSERVTEYALMIAKRNGMRDNQLEAFRYSALLHDVGKLMVRRAVLTKPSRLEKDEYEEIKTHPARGAEIVREIAFLRAAVDGVLYHHERLDGSGYPEGLQGDEVPEAARIMAVADTYDAMTSTRAYRGARSRQEALDELERFSGTQFDPRFVTMFTDALNEEQPMEEVVMGRLHEAIPSSAG